jgi:GAF domain-containing protein
MDERNLAQYFADLSRRLLEVEGVRETMLVLVNAAVESVEGCDHASISHLQGRSLVSAASSDRIGEILDGIQTGAGEGPCLDAIRTNQVAVAEDLEHDPRWPQYGPRAVESTSVRSSLGYPLYDGRRTIGALNLFSDVTGGFRQAPDEEGVTAILAAHSTAALASALHRETMAAALRNRDLIGQAKGMLMARSGVDEDEAFEILKRASQRTNIKVADLARRLVQGELDTDLPPH